MKLDELIETLTRLRKSDNGWVTVRKGNLMIDFDCGHVEGLCFKEESF